MFRSEMRASGLLVVMVMLLTAATGCRQEMAEAPYYDPLEATTFFEDGQSARKPPMGTVARGHLRLDDHFYTGRVNGELATTYPFEITRAVLDRGEERFNIYCTPCHGRTGDGNGMIVQRGFRQPTSFHSPTILAHPPGHYVDVMTNGFGAMPSYAAQVPHEDRWAIAAYIQALQLSRTVPVSALSAEQRARLESDLAGGAASEQVPHGTAVQTEGEGH
ncbi:MAG: cytochrome c [Acidobacteria bacterium]|nr:cytochrome c [Acidobacteriota bacterium]